jgi:uncharacterized protein YfaS (alpha-2-macroglobulin family)
VDVVTERLVGRCLVADGQHPSECGVRQRGDARCGGKKDSVRSSFPETLLYRPEMLTDEKGEATVPITMADSITTWRLLAEAVAQDGRLGSLMMGVPVSQDFFVDLDLPPIITQHDELAVPVPVYNHLKLAQKVTLTLLQDPWFEPLGPLVETIELGPGQAGVRYFRIKAVRWVGKRCGYRRAAVWQVMRSSDAWRWFPMASSAFTVSSSV